MQDINGDPLTTFPGKPLARGGGGGQLLIVWGCPTRSSMLTLPAPGKQMLLVLLQSGDSQKGCSARPGRKPRFL